MAVRNDAYSPIHDCAGVTTNPTTVSVLADTGELSPGLYDVRVLVGSSVAAVFYIQHRNAANTDAQSDVVPVRAAAGQTGQYVFKFDVNVSGQRVRVLPAANITGDAEATVQAIRIV